ncbi:MAG: Hsp33 family molecular chaperone HslO [Halanaerobiales bacterium]|nr:Hsp33 family molecular chaperone HslO [Halanaerobiales bacterium]
MKDQIIRASGAMGQVRIFAAVTTELVEEARQRHNTSPLATAALGRALTAGGLMGTMLKEGQRISLQFFGDGPLGPVFVIADVEGNVRGYVRHPEADLSLNDKGKLDVGRGIGNGNLYVIKDLGLKEPYKGSIPLVTGEIGEDLTHYFMKSEQTPSAVGVGVLVQQDYSVKASGGFIMQLLPHAEESTIQQLEANLAKLSGGVTQVIDEGKGPEELIEIILNGIEYHITERRDVRFKCNCNRERLEKIVINLGEEEARDILLQENKLELTCHFCNENYCFDEKDLDRLFAKV